jgi:uncharacterized membrane protein YhiD involved in acid resistance
MNTAATLWCSAAVGTLAGVGYPLHALLGTLFILGVNVGLRPASRWLVLPRTGVKQAARGRAGQSAGVVEFPIGEESGVTGNGRAVELQLDLTVEVNAQEVLVAVTPWVPRSFRPEIVIVLTRDGVETIASPGFGAWI